MGKREDLGEWGIPVLPSPPPPTSQPSRGPLGPGPMLQESPADRRVHLQGDLLGPHVVGRCHGDAATDAQCGADQDGAAVFGLVRICTRKDARSARQLARQTARQPVIQPASYPSSQATQPASPSASQPVGQPASPSVSQSANQAVSQTYSYPASKLAIQSAS